MFRTKKVHFMNLFIAKQNLQIFITNYIYIEHFGNDVNDNKENA